MSRCFQCARCGYVLATKLEKVDEFMIIIHTCVNPTCESFDSFIRESSLMDSNFRVLPLNEKHAKNNSENP